MLEPKLTSCLEYLEQTEGAKVSEPMYMRDWLEKRQTEVYLDDTPLSAFGGTINSKVIIRVVASDRKTWKW